MDELIEYIEQNEELQFLVSLDYSTSSDDLYTCSEWANLYDDLGDYGNNPLILNTDSEHHIWNMFAGYSYSAYAFLDHKMVLRYKFDMPNYYTFTNIYIPNLIESMYGCTNQDACNFDSDAVYDDNSCQFTNCEICEEYTSPVDCMSIEGCMWMDGDCMETNDSCITYDSQLDCMDNGQDCYWMGDHCMTGSSCTDPIALNFNPMADLSGGIDFSTCIYSSFINFGCTYEGALNYDENANVDDGSCNFMMGDVNQDGGINILDITVLINWILEIFN